MWFTSNTYNNCNSRIICVCLPAVWMCTTTCQQIVPHHCTSLLEKNYFKLKVFNLCCCQLQSAWGKYYICKLEARPAAKIKSKQSSKEIFVSTLYAVVRFYQFRLCLRQPKLKDVFRRLEPCAPVMYPVVCLLKLLRNVAKSVAQKLPRWQLKKNYSISHFMTGRSLNLAARPITFRWFGSCAFVNVLLL